MKKVVIILITSLIYTVMFSTKVLAANTYPFPNAITCDEGCEADPWGFYKRQCTSYAAWKVNESGVAMTNWMKGPNGTSKIFGNAENWDNNARTIGIPTSTAPQVGAVAQWDPYHSGAGSMGHVGFVESINSDGSVNISEYNFYTRNGYGTRNNVRADNYLIFKPTKSACGGSSAVIANNTISAGQNYSCATSQTIDIRPEFRSKMGSISHFYII